MSTNIRQMIKNINNGNNLDNNLPAYVTMLAGQYNSYALIQSMMQYYVICEQYEEGYFKEQEVTDTVHFLREIVKEVFTNAQESKENCLARIEAERTKVIRMMEVLTNYTDQFMIYEYILNRIEHKFDQNNQNADEDDSVFAQKILEFIMSEKDTFIVSERIKDVLGQLPIRMARSRFYELVKNSISLYKGSEKESLEGYLYMLRTSGMLYEPEAEGQYFANWGAFAAKLKTVDFDSLDEAGYQRLSGELKEKAEDITNASEMFIILEELINSLYVFLLTEPNISDDTISMWDKERAFCKEVVMEISNQKTLDKAQDTAVSIAEKLEQLEGIPEKIMTNIQHLMGSFELAREAYEEQITELQLQESFHHFEMAQDLLSTSTFVEFQEKSNQLVSDEMAQYETERLMDEFSAMFQGKSIRFVRAVIANVISRLPVFFSGVDEMSEYIQNSLQQCKDAAEKKASYELLKEIMEENA